MGKNKKTKYTHTGIVKCLVNPAETYKANLRRIGKWWETKQGRRFDKYGLEKGHSDHVKWGIPDSWRLEIKTIEKVG